jgi:hypothetical protein
VTMLVHEPPESARDRSPAAVLECMHDRAQ